MKKTIIEKSSALSGTAQQAKDRFLTKRRKFFLSLPILTWPLGITLFCALGGGSMPGETAPMPGLMTALPTPSLKPEKQDKLSLYDLADAAEKKRKEAISNDPYYKSAAAPLELPPFGELNDMAFPGNTSKPMLLENDSLRETGGLTSLNNKAETEKAWQRLTQINQSLSPASFSKPKETEPASPIEGSFSRHVDRLEDMMHLVKEQGAEDPEMQKLEGVLERIVEIQHPERMTTETAMKNNSKDLCIISTTVGNISDTGFYGVMEGETKTPFSNAIEAEVAEGQWVQEGAIIRLRLAQPILVAETPIPKGVFLYGRCHFREERIEVSVNSIRLGTSIFPVKLQVYDLDGLEGISMPGQIAKQLAQSSGRAMVERLELPGLDPSLKAQLAAAGVGAAKSFMSKKIATVRVKLNPGYQVLLK